MLNKICKIMCTNLPNYLDYSGKSKYLKPKDSMHWLF